MECEGWWVLGSRKFIGCYFLSPHCCSVTSHGSFWLLLFVQYQLSQGTERVKSPKACSREDEWHILYICLLVCRRVWELPQSGKLHKTPQDKLSVGFQASTGVSHTILETLGKCKALKLPPLCPQGNSRTQFWIFFLSLTWDQELSRSSIRFKVVPGALKKGMV